MIANVAKLIPRMSKALFFSIMLYSLLWSCDGLRERGDGIPRIYLFGMDSVSFNVKSECYMSYVKGGYSYPTINMEKIRAKYRGGLSAGFPKHSMTIKLKKAHSLAGLKKDRDWILNASYIDKSFMRHKVSFDLFNAFSADNRAPESAYVEVYMDSNYYGLFILMERMDASKLSIDKKDTASFIFKGPPIFLSPELLLDSGNFRTFNYRYQKYPRIEVNDIHSQLIKTRSLIAYSSDQEFSSVLRGVQKEFDLRNIIDWHLLLLVTNSSDGLRKNYYIYKKDSNTGIRIAPWDYDHTFGRDGDNEPSWEAFIDCKSNFILKRLLELNPHNYRENLKDRFVELKNQGILTSDNIIRMMDENYRMIEPYVDRNTEAWPVNAEHYYDSLNISQELELIKKWTVRHLRRVEDLILSY